MKLSVIIPSYNGEKVLKSNLPIVLKRFENYKNGSVEMIISDDCSTDSSVEIVESFIEGNKNSKVNLKLLKTDKNKGFSGNVNNAVKSASGDILILLNTDVEPEINFLDPLLEHFTNEKVFAVGCMDKSIEGNKIVLRGRGIGHWEKALLMHAAGNIEKLDTLWVSGGSGAFRKSIWDQLGGLDEIYNPFYWEDIDLSYRARKSGYLTLFERKSVVKHEHEEGVIKKEFSSNKVKTISYRNQFIFTWINSDFGTFISSFFWIPYHLAKAMFSKDLEMISGFIKASIMFPRILNSRKRARRHFVLKDKEVILLS